MAGFPYRLYGGAQRPDAISGLDTRFSQALLRLYAAAPPEVQRELALNSAYRSKAVQQQLWNKSDKTGHSVARPGQSKHQFGTAADLYGFGLGGNNSVSQATRDWVNANAAAQGLYFPMKHEPWHLQLRDPRLAPTDQGSEGIEASVGPLASMLSEATAPEDPRDAFYSGLASGINKGAQNRRQDSSPDLIGGPGGVKATVLPPQMPSAIPSDTLKMPPIQPAIGNLADLFQVKDIGTPPLLPGRRF